MALVLGTLLASMGGLWPGAMAPSALLSFPEPFASGLPTTSAQLPWPAVLWPGKCLGILLIEPCLDSLYFLLLFEFFWASEGQLLPCWLDP